MRSYACRDVQEFEKLQRLGEGTYGKVYQARDKISGRIVALKKLRLAEDHSREGFPVTALREIKLLKRIAHSNVVELLSIAVGTKPSSIFLVFEYCDSDLAKVMDNLGRPFEEPEIKLIMLNLLQGVHHIHQQLLIHRDLKPSNCLISDSGTLKLADFGLARLCGHPLRSYTPKVVTLWYRAPELLLGASTYHTAVDMWAVGCIFGELLQGRPLFPGKTELKQLELIFDLLGSPTERVWPGYNKLPGVQEFHSLPIHAYSQLALKFKNICTEDALDLLSKLLEYDPGKRLNASKALDHPYFSTAPHPIDVSQMPLQRPVLRTLRKRVREPIS